MESSKKDNTKKNFQAASDQAGNALNINQQTGTDVTIEYLRDLSWKAAHIAKVNWEQGKGNLMEYIEAVKFARNYANAGHGVLDISPVTDLPLQRGGFGLPADPVDLQGVQGGKVIFAAQFKVNNNPYATVENFLNPKYEGMQLVTTSDNYDNVVRIFDKMLEDGQITQAKYDDTIGRMRVGLTDDRTGISSGGTSMEELEDFRGNDGKIDVAGVEERATEIKIKQMGTEAAQAALYGAAAGAIMGGVVSGVKNICEVYKGEKKGKEALKDFAGATAKSACRGGAIAGTAALARTVAKDNNVSLLSDGVVSIAMTSALADCSVAIYDYIKGEISGDDLLQELQGTVVSSGTVLCTNSAIKVVATAGGAFLPVALPMAVYTISASMLKATMDIIDQANLNAEEHRKARALIEKETEIRKEHWAKFNGELARYRDSQREIMQKFISDFDYYVFVQPNYEMANAAINGLSSKMGIKGNYNTLDKFKKAMESDKPLDFT